MSRLRWGPVGQVRSGQVIVSCFAVVIAGIVSVGSIIAMH